MTQKLALWLLMALLALPAAVISQTLERKRSKHYPQGTPYRWGFFVSLDVAFLGAFVLIHGIINALAGNYASFLWKLAFGSVYLAMGWLGVRRSRSGFVASTILTLNPVFYVVSALYLRHRWKELGNPAVVTTIDGRRRQRVYRNMY